MDKCCTMQLKRSSRQPQEENRTFFFSKSFRFFIRKFSSNISSGKTKFHQCSRSHRFHPTQTQTRTLSIETINYIEFANTKKTIFFSSLVTRTKNFCFFFKFWLKIDDVFFCPVVESDEVESVKWNKHRSNIDVDR